MSRHLFPGRPMRTYGGSQVPRRRPRTVDVKPGPGEIHDGALLGILRAPNDEVSDPGSALLDEAIARAAGRGGDE